MNMSIEDATRRIWSAIQRISPSVSREEIATILRELVEAPTADEGPRYVICKLRGTKGGLTWTEHHPDCKGKCLDDPVVHLDASTLREFSGAPTADEGPTHDKGWVHPKELADEPLPRGYTGPCLPACPPIGMLSHKVTHRGDHLEVVERWRVPEDDAKLQAYCDRGDGYESN